MPMTRTAMIDDDGSGTTGTILNNAWKQELYNQIDALVSPYGIWTAVPFDAANFSNFTVTAAQVVTNRYTRLGNTVVWAISVDGATTPGGLTAMNFRIPTGSSAAVTGRNAAVLHQGGVWMAGLVTTSVGSPIITMNKMDFTAFVAGTVFLGFTITFEVV